MDSCSTRPQAQTLKRAKADYKKNGPQISKRVQQQLERGAELERRAQSLREAEKRRKIGLKRKQEREQRERDDRVRSGFGIATQLAGYSHTQKQMKRGMEAFVRLNKAAPENVDSGCLEKEGAQVEKDKLDPWDEEDLDEDSLLDIAQDVTTLPNITINSGEPKDSSERGSASRGPEFTNRTGPSLDGQSPKIVPNNMPAPAKRIHSNRVPTKPVKTGVNFMKASIFRQMPQRDEWDFFLDSSTQIAREISASPSTEVHNPDLGLDIWISTQDLDMSIDDLDEIGVLPKSGANHGLGKSDGNVDAPAGVHKTRRHTPLRETHASAAKQHSGMKVQPPSVKNTKSMMLPPPKPVLRSPHTQLRIQTTASKPTIPLTGISSENYGFSTQDMNSIFDDEVAFSPD